MALPVFLGAFGFLLHLLYGTLAPYRDSGDLASAAHTLGIAHPPGYALYTLLTKLLSLTFPFGNPAYQANFLSALWTAAAAVLLFAILRKKAGAACSFLACFVWILSGSVLHLSLVSEMYTLNALFCALVLLFWVRAMEDHSPERRFRWECLAFFTLGLGLNNQPTIVFLLPGLLAHGLWMHWRLGWKSAAVRVLFWAGFGAVGFSLLIFYPIRSFQQPVLDWGNPENLENLWRLITRANYGGLKLHPEQSELAWTGQKILIQLKLFAQTEWRELTGVGIVLMLLGIARQIRKKDSALLWIGIPWLLSGPVFFVLSNMPVEEKTTLPILEPYLVMVHLLAAFWIAEGAWILLRMAGEKFNESRLLRAGAAGLAAVIVLFLQESPAVRRNDFYAYDYGKNLCRTLPRQATLFDPDDVTAFTLSYLQVAENYRADLVPLVGFRTRWGYELIRARRPELVPPGEFGNAHDFMQGVLQHHLRTGRPLFADHASKFPSWIAQFPVGIAVRAVSDSGSMPQNTHGTANPISVEDFTRAQNIFHFYVERPGGRGLTLDRHPDFFSHYIVGKMSAAFNNVGVWLQGRQRYSEAAAYFRRALARDPSLTAAWNNLGVNQYLQGHYAAAAEFYRQGLRFGEKPQALYVPLGLAEHRAGQRDQARQSLLEALKFVPQNLTALNELGLLAMEEKKWSEAREWFQKTVAADAQYAAAHYNLGLVARQEGDSAAAARHWENYLRASPAAEDRVQVNQWIAALKKQND